MAFIADKQTLEDLNLLGKFKPQSIYNLFNKVRTTGGERLLEAMFHQPLTDADAINARSGIFQYFQDKALAFPVPRDVFRVAENYLSQGTGGNILSVLAMSLRKKMAATLLRDEQFAALQEGLRVSVELLRLLRAFAAGLDTAGSPYQSRATELKTKLADHRLDNVIAATGKLSLWQLARYDFLLRNVLRNEIEIILNHVYELDVYIAVSDVSRARHFSYAKALPKAQHVIRTTALCHPALEKAVANPITLDSENNLLFLTGANMAGKSTFMKSFGIAIYMGHMGFPVAAKEMQFSVRDGLYTSINVADNLNLGYSHFYAEVLRVKTVAQEVAQAKDLVVIFDELFKGTNVKDAYDATLAVTEAFAAYRNSVFIVSTHIIEVGEALQQRADNVQFRYLPTILEGTVPKYTYQLRTGITNDRQGMMIIENEGILETLQA